MERDEALRRADAVEFGAREPPRQLALKLLVFKLHRGHGVHEVARCDPPAGPDDGSEGRERFFCAPLAHVYLVEEPGGVSEIERFPLERGTKNVAGDEPDRGGEVGISQKLPALFDELGVRFEGDEGTRSADALAEAFEPERGGASDVEDIEALDVAE